MLLAHRVVRLQSLSAFVSDLRPTDRFSMICQGTRSVERYWRTVIIRLSPPLSMLQRSNYLKISGRLAHLLAAREGLKQSALVGIFQVPTHRQSPGQARDLDPVGTQLLLQVQGGGIA